MLRLSFLHVETEVGHDRGLLFLDKVSVCLDRECHNRKFNVATECNCVMTEFFWNYVATKHFISR